MPLAQASASAPSVTFSVNHPAAAKLPASPSKVATMVLGAGSR